MMCLKIYSECIIGIVLFWAWGDEAQKDWLSCDHCFYNIISSSNIEIACFLSRARRDEAQNLILGLVITCPSKVEIAWLLMILGPPSRSLDRAELQY